MCARARVCVCAFVCAFVCASTCMCVCACARARVSFHTRTRTHASTHAPCELRIAKNRNTTRRAGGLALQQRGLRAGGVRVPAVVHSASASAL